MSKIKYPDSKVISITNVRLSFCENLTKAGVNPDYPESAPKFQSSFLLDPKHEKYGPSHAAKIKEIAADIKRLKQEMWGGEPPRFKPLECFGKGENYISKQTRKPYSGYEGMYVVAAKNAKQPLLQDASGKVLTPEQAREIFYAGCRVSASVKYYVQNPKYGDAIRCELRVVKFKTDDEAFGAAPPSADELEDDTQFDDDDLLKDDLGLDDDGDGALESEVKVSNEDIYDYLDDL